MTRLVCLSDTHNMLSHVKVPDGDILVHAGDATMYGKPEELARFNADLARLPHPHKFVISGNHDWLWQTNPGLAKGILTAATYLQDELGEALGLKIWGSPWTPRFHDWAFNADRGHPIRRYWDLIPDGVDVLVTHGPPRNYGDRISSHPRPGGKLRSGAGKGVGCDDLLFATHRTKPGYHVFGHIHEGYGVYKSAHGTTYVNAAICDENYSPLNEPIVFEV